MEKKQIGVGLFVFIIALAFFPLAKFILFREKLPPTEPGRKIEAHEAKFWKTLAGGRVQCQLCPNQCILAEGQRGLCKVRENISGKLYSLVYGQPVSIHVDPIEKKPLYHFLPGAEVYSLATVGCSLACQYCQNWDISQRSPEDVKAYQKSPAEVVAEALGSGVTVIAFTYSEPTVFYEYMFDIAQLAKEKGLRTVMISSGYINPEPLKELLPYLDAMKVDLKGFNEEFYQEIVGGKLEPVLTTLKIVKEAGLHLEIVNLVVPSYNDDETEIRSMCEWIKDNLGADTPLHFSRFHPDYKLKNLPPTPPETLRNAREICQEVGLDYVYIGNLPDYLEGNTTFCPDNGQALITRKGWFVEKNEVKGDGRSESCPSQIPGVWE